MRAPVGFGVMQGPGVALHARLSAGAAEPLRVAFAHAFRPTIILLPLLACHYLHKSLELFLPIGLGYTFLMTALEQIMPARPEWKPLSSFKQVAVDFAFRYLAPVATSRSDTSRLSLILDRSFQNERSS
ncbi:hypothetical protein WME89_08825 [Sorangium sp. So ce321]|uniref:hypothetical protein n=1 Tax=Sorangium sp. So ce321 TaxID=3133300 RepID=UPI003F62C517